MRRLLLLALLIAFSQHARAAELAFRTEEIGTGLTVGYAVTVVDVNADKRPDILVVDSGRVIWYENPSWKLHTIIEGQTKKDNVCIAPYDIDGDGRLDFALVPIGARSTRAPAARCNGSRRPAPAASATKSFPSPKSR